MTQTPPIAQPGRKAERVEILLATYNSADYLEPLLASLQAQTLPDFHLIISDDCSTDATVAILERHLGGFRNPVRLIRRETPSGSAAANFASLMQISTGDYVFLCDADDIWDADKLDRFLALARRKVAEHGPDTPLFLYSDARIVDAQGGMTHPSYWAFKNTDARRCLRLERLLQFGPMLGCASMMNRALVARAADVPVGRIAGHDWWIALVAASLGHVDILPEATISYRIHGRNNSHPREVSLGAARRLPRPFHEMRRRQTIRQRQAEPLLEQFGTILTPDRRRIIEGFVGLGGRSFLGRRIGIFGNGYVYPDTLRNLALFAFC